MNGNEKANRSRKADGKNNNRPKNGEQRHTSKRRFNDDLGGSYDDMGESDYAIRNRANRKRKIRKSKPY